jgi:hypothetical protein
MKNTRPNQCHQRFMGERVIGVCKVATEQPDYLYL